MEPISEERQRKVLEWFYGLPSQKQCLEPVGEVDGCHFGIFTLLESHDGVSTWRQEPCCVDLYIKDSSGNWRPNYQWVHAEAVAQLLKEGCGLWFATWSGWTVEGETETWGGTDDPIAALAEYVEAK